MRESLLPTTAGSKELVRMLTEANLDYYSFLCRVAVTAAYTFDNVRLKGGWNSKSSKYPLLFDGRKTFVYSPNSWPTTTRPDTVSCDN